MKCRVCRKRISKAEDKSLPPYEFHIRTEHADMVRKLLNELRELDIFIRQYEKQIIGVDKRIEAC